MEKAERKTIGIAGILLVILAASIAGTLAKLGAKELFEPRQLTEKEILYKTAQELRKKIPIKTAENTTFIHAMADPYEMAIIYEYIIDDVRITSPKQKQQITKELRKNIMIMCNSRNPFKIIKKYKWNYLFPISGEEIQVTLEKADCALTGKESGKRK